MEKLNFLGKLEMELQLERLVIGIEEPILVKDLGEIMAKIDSGNGGYNVIHGEDITYQGNQVLFLTYDGAGNPRRMSKKLKEELDVHIGGGIVQKRPVVELDIKFANEEYKKIPFSITDRTENTHRILISKEFVEKTIEALIDVGAKNISCLKYDVDYEPVHEASNEMENIKLTDDASSNSSNSSESGKKGNIFSRTYDKAASAKKKVDGFLDKINNAAERLKPHGDILPEKEKNKKEEEYVKTWKKPAKAFANYKEFYKQDQELIKTKIITNDAVRAELNKGDQSNLLIKDGKILANKLKGISIFSYLLKKGDGGPAGKGGSPIKGQEQRRELWFKYNNDSKKALKALQKEEKKNASNQEEVVPKENETQMGESLDKIFSKVSKMILEASSGGISHSFDATNMGASSLTGSSTPSDKSKSDSEDIKNEKSKNSSNKDKSSKEVSKETETFSDEEMEEVKSESERILGLKGFILYYIPLCNKDNKSSLQALNERILSGTFDDSMSSFITSGQGDNVGGIEKITSSIKQFVTSNQKLLSELPGVFALCYSQSLIDEKAPRNIVFIPKSVIVSPSQNEQENAPGDQEEINYVTSLKEKLNLPPDTLDGSEEQNLVSLLSQASETESDTSQDIDIETLKEKLGIPSQIKANDVNINLVADILNPNKHQEGESELDVESFKKKLGIEDLSGVTVEDIANVIGTTGEASSEKESQNVISAEDIKRHFNIQDLEVNDVNIKQLVKLIKPRKSRKSRKTGGNHTPIKKALNPTNIEK